MVGREQIRPLAPASDRHASDDYTETPDHLKKKPLKTKTWFRVCMFIAAFFLIIAIVVVILIFTIFKIKNPTINLNRISINQLDLNNVTAILTSQNISLTAEVSVKNPNYATFKYPNTNTSLFYRGTVIGEARGPPGQAKARRTVFINETVDLIIGKLVSNPSLQSDIRSTLLPITSYTRVGGRVKILNFIRRHITVSLNCSVMVNLTSQAIQEQKCSRKVKL